MINRFERQQYVDMRELWTSGREEWVGKGVGDTYGAEHLARLLGKTARIYLMHLAKFFSSLIARVDCSNQHGSAICQPPPCGTRQVYQLAGQARRQILRQRV